MSCAEDAAPDHAKDRHRAHVKRGRCFVEGHFAALAAFAFAIDGDPAPIAQARDPALRPAIVATCPLAGAVQNRCDGAIRHQTREFVNERLSFFGDRPAVFAARVLLDLQRGVIAAAPVRNHVDEAVLDPHDDLMQNGAYDPLARRHGGGWM